MSAARGARLGTTGGSGSDDPAWDIHQYGYMGGDSQNRGGRGIGFGMGRRQLVGPREMGGGGNAGGGGGGGGGQGQG